MTTAIPVEWSELQRLVPCMAACPAQVRVPAYIRAIADGDCPQATALNREDVLFPGVLGRICVRPCEDVCRRICVSRDAPVAICHLKRATADRAPAGDRPLAPLAGPTGRRVAVVGAGPAGIAAAHHLARFGHAVTVLDAGEEPGGLIAAGIPAFRLPVELRRQETVTALRVEGITLRCGVRLGDGPWEVPFARLREEHDAVVIATGCGRAVTLDLPGAELAGVGDGLAFVRSANAGAPLPESDRVVVVGAGFTAIDCARIARRQGASSVQIVYRRERRDASPRKEDLAATLAEGVTFHERLLPVAFLGEGHLEAVRLVRTEVGVDPDSGLRRAQPIPGSEHEVPADTAIVAVGQVALPLAGAAFDVVDAATGRTSLDGVFVAGDRAYGARTVVDAVGHGAHVAREVDAWLAGRVRVRRTLVARPVAARGREASWDETPRAAMPELRGPARLAGMSAEVEIGLADAAVAAEARRCYECDDVYRIDVSRCVFCEKCVVVCPTHTITLTWDGQPGGRRSVLRRLATFWRRPERGITLDVEGCIRCGRCAEVCPTACIPVDRLEITTTIDAPARPEAAG